MTKSERRLAEGLFWPTSDAPKKTLWQRYRRWAPLMVPALLLVCYFLAHEPARLAQALDHERSTATRALELQKKETQHFVKLLASVFNGSPVLDKASDTAYFFERPLAVKLGEPNGTQSKRRR